MEMVILNRKDVEKLLDLEDLLSALGEGFMTISQGNAVSPNRNQGSFTFEQIRVGYREGQPCPVCSTPIEKIKTGSTSSFICPACQKL